MIARRQFLKAGIAGSLLLALAGRVHAASDERRAMLVAVSSAILKGLLPEDAAARRAALGATATGVERAVAGLSLPVQKEVGELFSLLANAGGRRLLAGVPAAWSEARGEDVSAFLTAWRYSRFALLRTAYAALHDLVFGAWYARTENWAAIGYGGPPEVF